MSMESINFISCGQVGDLFHQLFVIKSMCDDKKCKANLYIADFSYGLCVGGNFTFDINKTFQDIYKIVKSQPYIDNFEILGRDFNYSNKSCSCGFRQNCIVPDDSFIYLNKWRLVFSKERKSWTDLLSDYFSVKKIDKYQYIQISETDQNVFGKVLIHNSNKRHNVQFPWDSIINSIDKDILFITTDLSEFENFRFKTNRIKPYIVSTLSDMSNAIGSCDLFIGNQSAPLAIASALDVPRIAELHSSSYEFYVNEQSYSENISWFSDSNNKYNSNKINIKI